MVFIFQKIDLTTPSQTKDIAEKVRTILQGCNYVIASLTDSDPLKQTYNDVLYVANNDRKKISEICLNIVRGKYDNVSDKEKVYAAAMLALNGDIPLLKNKKDKAKSHVGNDGQLIIATLQPYVFQKLYEREYGIETQDAIDAPTKAVIKALRLLLLDGDITPAESEASFKPPSVDPTTGFYTANVLDVKRMPGTKTFRLVSIPGQTMFSFLSGKIQITSDMLSWYGPKIASFMTKINEISSYMASGGEENMAKASMLAQQYFSTDPSNTNSIYYQIHQPGYSSYLANWEADCGGANNVFNFFNTLAVNQVGAAFSDLMKLESFKNSVFGNLKVDEASVPTFQVLAPSLKNMSSSLQSLQVNLSWSPLKSRSGVLALYANGEYQSLDLQLLSGGKLNTWSTEVGGIYYFIPTQLALKLGVGYEKTTGEVPIFNTKVKLEESDMFVTAGVYKAIDLSTNFLIDTRVQGLVQTTFSDGKSTKPGWLFSGGVTLKNPDSKKFNWNTDVDVYYTKDILGAPIHGVTIEGGVGYNINNFLKMNATGNFDLNDKYRNLGFNFAAIFTFPSTQAKIKYKKEYPKWY